ncbi:MAG: tetratricopeptide repeat protein [Deltaproteobacteria bacterium]|nr:tetratricopeptide repeat protein [Deltaproteobacteria bacterium]
MESNAAASSEKETHDPKEARIESLTSSLSRAQSKIEELDAKLSALSDKVDATRISVDNISGNKPLKTESVGSAREESKAEVEAERAAVHARIASKKAVATMDSALGEFNRAMSTFKAGKYTDAVLAFNHFTEQYPEHVMAGSAQFYAGESYFMMSEYKLALNEFQKVTTSFSSSPRVSSALVRMSHCYDAIGNTGEAARTMALARDLYEGNPSLDWPAPAGKKTGKPTAPVGHSSAPTGIEQKPVAHAAAKPQLDAAPMEPKSQDDSKIDDVEAKE